jgi:hypothetical protein
MTQITLFIIDKKVILWYNVLLYTQVILRILSANTQQTLRKGFDPSLIKLLCLRVYSINQKITVIYPPIYIQIRHITP